MYRCNSRPIPAISVTPCHSDLWVFRLNGKLCSAMYLFNKVLPLDSTLVSGTREWDCSWMWSCCKALFWSKVYYIAFNKNLLKSSLRQLTIILLIGWNVFQTWLSGRLCSLCLPVQGRWTCVQRQGLRGQALYPSCSVTRGLKLISSRSHKNREKERERPLTGRGFFFSFFSEVNRMSAPLTFHRGKQLFIWAQQRQRPTWEPSDIIQLI